MAIEKIKKTKIEISKAAAVQMAISAALAVLSIILGYMAFVKWRFKANLVSGYESYDSNDLEGGRKGMEAALSWRPDHVGARELLAKIYCDTNVLDRAEENYNRILAQGADRPEIFVGLGVLYVKKADKAEAKEVPQLLRQARDYFERAGGIPEAAIGLGHCDLLEAERLSAADNPRRYEAAIRRFKKLREDMAARQDYRASCSRWGLIDYYAGLGKALSASDAPEDLAAASAAFRSCYQMVRRWPLPMANILLMEARRFHEKSYERTEMLAMKKEALDLRREMELWKNAALKDAYAEVKDPWLQYTMALAKAFLWAGEENDYDALVREVTGGLFENRPEPYLFNCAQRTRWALKDESAKETEARLQKAAAAYKALLGQAMFKEERAKAWRAAAHNNLGWILAWLGSYNGNETTLREARAQLEEAVKIFPGDYVFNRNLCVVLRRLRRPEKEFLPYLEKAKAADKGDLAEDFGRFQQYMGVQ